MSSRIDKRTIQEFQISDLRTLVDLADKCCQVEEIARMHMKSDPLMRMAIYTLIQHRVSLQSKLISKSESLRKARRNHFTLTLPIPLLLAIHHLLTRTEMVEKWEATELLRLIDKYI